MLHRPSIYPGFSCRRVALLQPRNQRIRYHILHTAMVRPISELAKIAVHILRRDVDVGQADRSLRQFPNAFNVVRMVRHVLPKVIVRPFLRAMLVATGRK